MNCLDWLRTPRVMQSLKIKVLIWMCYTVLVKHNRWEILTLSSCNLREHLVGEVDIFNFVGYIHGGFLYPFIHRYYVGEVALFNLIKPQFEVLGATESSSTIQLCLETCLSDTL
ncbi:unnamed protein product [Camellia sinensis]